MQPVLAPNPAIVLDTNVVLDWLVFRNPECKLLGERLLAGQLRWLTSSAMREELEHVLARGHLDAWRPDLPTIRLRWGQASVEIEPPAPAVPSPRLRCSDPDDQKFIDLALALGARWLISRDRAVLKLARRARGRGLEILTPGAWAAANATD